MQTALEPGESVVKQGKANLQRGIETVGGHAYLTNRRLVFESHKFNVQRGSTIVPLSEVTEVGRAWTKFLNVLPLAKNSVRVATGDGGQHKIVCSGAGKWAEAIDEQRSGSA